MLIGHNKMSDECDFSGNRTSAVTKMLCTKSQILTIAFYRPHLIPRGEVDRAPCYLKNHYSYESKIL